MKYYQLIRNGINEAIVKTREFRQVIETDDIHQIIKNSWNKFKSLDENELEVLEGFDIDDIDDFIAWHNLRNKINIIRFNIEDINLD